MRAISERRAIGAEIFALSNLIRRQLPGGAAKSVGGIDFTGMQGLFIGYLSEHSKTKDVFQRDLEEEFEIRRPTATGILQLMERDGLITRESVSYDARLKKLMLTTKAKEISWQIGNMIDQIEAKLSSGLTREELDTFFRVMELIKKNAQ